jgi:exopolysaccharide biosynthesis polyprenyl glycosylphosphotransferase
MNSLNGERSSPQTVLPVRRLVGFAPPMTWQRWTTSALKQNWAPGCLYLFLDAATWFIICNLAAYFRQSNGLPLSPTSPETQLLGFGMIVLLLFTIGGYDRRVDMCSLAHTSEHLIALAGATVLASLLIYSIAAYNEAMRPSRGVLLVSFLLFAPSSLLYRRAISRAVAVDTAKRLFLVIGAGEVARRFYAAYTRSTNREQLRFLDLTGESIGKPVGGEGSPLVEGEIPIDQLGSELSGIVLAETIGQFTPELIERLVRLHFQKVPVYTLEGFYEIYWRRVPVYNIDPLWPLQAGFHLARNSTYSQIKRIFDIFASGVVLLAISPLLAVLVLLTWWDSGRPAIFRQTRVGCENRPFTIYKFRTMYALPAGRQDDLYARAKDPRITPLGRWLRKLRLDELPQLINVLKGDMSLIGPRAEWIRCVERYEGKIPSYHLRHLVKPGITGWAQVNYPYGESEEDALQKLKYDLYYIRHYSLRLDAMIVLKTLHIMLWGKGQ